MERSRNRERFCSTVLSSSGSSERASSISCSRSSGVSSRFWGRPVLLHAPVAFLRCTLEPVHETHPNPTLSPFRRISRISAGSRIRSSTSSICRRRSGLVQRHRRLGLLLRVLHLSELIGNSPASRASHEQQSHPSPGPRQRAQGGRAGSTRMQRSATWLAPACSLIATNPPNARSTTASRRTPVSIRTFC